MLLVFSFWLWPVFIFFCLYQNSMTFSMGRKYGVSYDDNGNLYWLQTRIRASKGKAAFVKDLLGFCSPCREQLFTLN